MGDERAWSRRKKPGEMNGRCQEQWGGERNRGRLTTKAR